MGDCKGSPDWREPEGLSRCAAGPALSWEAVAVPGWVASVPPGGTKSRRGRSISRTRHVELLVVADFSLYQALGSDIREYLLVLFAAADRLYRHPSLASDVRLAVTRILVMRHSSEGPEVLQEAQQSLHNFCEWQRQMRARPEWAGEKYDAAVLLTRENLCQEHFCESLGLAHIGTVCETNLNCAVIQDIGLQSAFTIAHEIGHLLGMPHDSSDICIQVGELPSSNQMMSNLLTRIDYSEPWSRCSSKLSLGFFESGRGGCTGHNVRTVYPASQSDCVWCARVSHAFPVGVAASQFPWLGLEGNAGSAPPRPSMKPERLCQRRATTVDMPLNRGDSSDQQPEVEMPAISRLSQPQKPIDGNWGSWGPWGQCSRTCGGGVQFSRRRCDNPLPAAFGRYCQGRRDIFQSCNLAPCPDNGQTYRAEQCEARNIPAPNGQGYYQEWEPYYHGIREADLCKLNCLLKGTLQVTVFNIKVKDGTRCTPHSDAVCVRSRCVKTGCDGVIGSRKRYNKCGMCGGEDSACRRIIRRFHKRTVNYSDVAVIPIGAANFKARQEHRRGQTRLTAYLALKRLNGSYILNGDTQISGFDSLLSVGGVDLRYLGWSPQRDVLGAVTRGGLTEPLVLQVYTPSRQRVVRVLYSYYIPREQAGDRKPIHKTAVTLTSHGAVPNPTLTECNIPNATSPTMVHHVTLPTHTPAEMLTTHIGEDTLATLSHPLTPILHTTTKDTVPSHRPTPTVASRRPTSTVPSRLPTSTVPSRRATLSVPGHPPTSTMSNRKPTPTVPSHLPTSTVPSRRSTPTVPSRGTTSTLPSHRTRLTVPSRRTTSTVPNHRTTMPSRKFTPTLTPRSITKVTLQYGQPGKREPSSGLHNAKLPTPKRRTLSLYRPPQPTRVRLNPPLPQTKASSTSWHPGPWQSCSVTCGVGWRVRWIQCLDRRGVLSVGCDYQMKPASMALCVMQRC
ncbi:A disintegrin and metalloproteinase with thrombospondin motifs 5-like [Chiloscyllium plagiosum]|uniref:A disintegrin and metalloproteinase with thrombospondin motifs 5-like n=1 Tax=Chiloscyllium plagiosum TaxID=36176 RepID=UPI001CB8375D|nr:A disintegrin and metalloproteinase with thrombospondin motifs 5-like [Chiloscyllium plagiosum]